MKISGAIEADRITCATSFVLAVCVGIFFGRSRPDILTLLVLISVVTFLTAIKRRSWIVLIACVAIGLTIGIWRGSSYAGQIAKYDRYFDKTVIVTGKVADDPGYDVSKQTEFHVGDVSVFGSKLPGKIRVRSLGAGQVGRGDTVTAVGTLRKTIGTSRQGALSFATVTVTHKTTSWVESLRSRFFASVYSSLPEPQASLGLGYLVGVRSSLPTDFALALSVVGLTHIVAVSGYNLTIIVQFVKRFFEKRSAYQTVFFSAVLIASFIVVTGMSPSILRAAIISGFSLLAWYYGRKFSPTLLLLLGASITACASPLYIWGDVGWYLSFLAFAGVLLIAPIVMHYLGRYSKNILIAVLVETLCAQLLTLPYISVIFGRISVISPVANLLVIPFIPLAMLLIFVTGVVGMLSPVLALWVAVPARALMTFAVWVVENLSRIPWAQSKIQLDWRGAVAVYLLIFVLIAVAWWRARDNTKARPDTIDWNLL